MAAEKEEKKPKKRRKWKRKVKATMRCNFCYNCGAPQNIQAVV